MLKHLQQLPQYSVALDAISRDVTYGDYFTYEMHFHRPIVHKDVYELLTIISQEATS